MVSRSVYFVTHSLGWLLSGSADRWTLVKLLTCMPSRLTPKSCVALSPETLLYKCHLFSIPGLQPDHSHGIEHHPVSSRTYEVNMTDPTLSHCTAGDVRELAELYLAAFAEAPLRQVMYRGLTHEAVVQRLEKSFAKTVAAQSDTSSRQTHFLKITEPKTNEIMAVIIWIYLPNGYKPAEDPQTQVSEIPAGGNEQLIRDIAVKTAELRSENSGRHEGHWRKCLKSMAII